MFLIYLFISDGTEFVLLKTTPYILDVDTLRRWSLSSCQMLRCLGCSYRRWSVGGTDYSQCLIRGILSHPWHFVMDNIACNVCNVQCTAEKR